ncbi:6-carboxytetrahydropterin synthase QueD [Raoultibacter phocaeensis]|uniref:6-carboxytetrahydropterin synthase QueD n=1 Tax=Raoultibacter phocaeensis TaxID=2479841 RepID=UPI001C577096|nr:6-carboxytetrahydropterin synthase QueD [Raoultibacter phocaeensis]
MKKAYLNTDGGSRGNPGVAGFGFDLVNEHGERIVSGGWFLPKATNNVAEYSALIWGLENALAAGVTSVEVRADSELMVKQMLGQYKVKSDDLKPLHMRAKELFSRFESARIAHVYRSENKNADALANETMDARGPVGDYLVPWEDAPASLFDLEAPARAGGENLPEQTGSQHVMMEGSAMEHNPAYTGPGRLSGETYEHAGGHYELTVKDHFDSAHALPGYDGPCRFLHGHTWDIEATLAGQHLDEVGMLYDFKTIKRDLHAILENFDHRLINEVAPFDVINPTAEHLARVIFYELEKTLPAPISLKEVAVWESPLARVAYRP